MKTSANSRAPKTLNPFRFGELVVGVNATQPSCGVIVLITGTQAESSSGFSGVVVHSEAPGFPPAYSSTVWMKIDFKPYHGTVTLTAD